MYIYIKVIVLAINRIFKRPNILRDVKIEDIF